MTTIFRVLTDALLRDVIVGTTEIGRRQFNHLSGLGHFNPGSNLTVSGTVPTAQPRSENCFESIELSVFHSRAVSYRFNFKSDPRMKFLCQKISAGSDGIERLELVQRMKPALRIARTRPRGWL